MIGFDGWLKDWKGERAKTNACICSEAKAVALESLTATCCWKPQIQILYFLKIVFKILDKLNFNLTPNPFPLFVMSVTESGKLLEKTEKR